MILLGFAGDLHWKFLYCPCSDLEGFMSLAQPAVMATRAMPKDPLAALALLPLIPPPLSAGEVRAVVRAGALNHHDLWTLRGVSAVPLSYPRVMGSDGAGDGVLFYPVLGGCQDPSRCYGCSHDDLSLCERSSLIGESRDGTLAPSVVLPADHVVASPRHLSDIEAACLPSAYLTAYRQLFRAAQTGAGDTILVTGATGGIGVAAIQLGSALGARMIAQIRTRAQPRAVDIQAAGQAGGAEGFADDLADDFAVEKELLALGADRVLTLDDDVKSQVGPVDVVLENVGEATWKSSLRALRPGGTLVVSGATSGANPPADLRRIFWRGLRVIGVSLGSRSDLEHLVSFVEDTRMRPRVAAVYPLEQAREAFTHLMRGRVLGKIVLQMESSADLSVAPITGSP